MKQKLTTLWNKYVNYETVSYFICGVLTTILNLAVYAVCYNIFVASEQFAPLAGTIANIIAWVVAVIFAFFVNKIFVFKSKVWRGRALFDEFWKFMVARLLSFAFEEVFILVVVDLLHFDYMIFGKISVAKLFASVFVMIMNYFASKFLIFVKKEEKPDV